MFLLFALVAHVANPSGTRCTAIFDQQQSLSMTRLVFPRTSPVVSIRSVFHEAQIRTMLREDMSAFSICQYRRIPSARGASSLTVFYCSAPSADVHEIHSCVHSDDQLDQAMLQLSLWHEEAFPNVTLVSGAYSLYDDLLQEAEDLPPNDEEGEQHFD